jgi:acetylornithine deacetylase/succinyl-diaminopimelate desuccinylase-like protein
VTRSTDELLDELFAFLRIPSISSGDGEDRDLRRAAEWVCERVRDAGGSAEVVETQRNPLAVGRIRCGVAGAPHLLVYGHYDVQSVVPLEAWESPPFEPELRDGFIYGRGASDDKGNMHCLLAPLVDLARAGDLTCDVTVLSDGEEEIGGDSVVRHIAASDARFDAAIVFDGAMIARGWPAITTGVRGIAQGNVEVRTGVRDVHSGLYGGAALNAAHVLCDLLAACAARDGRLPAPLAAGVRPPDEAEIASWATLPSGGGELENAGIAPLDAGAVGEYYLRTLALPTFDVNAITCRDAAHQRTIIPCEAAASVSLRLVPDQDPDAIWAAFEALLREHAPAGADVVVRRKSASAGCAYDPSEPAIQAARRVLADTLDHDCALVRTGGAIPLVSALHARGIPCVLSGVALPEDNIHAPNERMLLANYEAGVRAGRALYGALADALRTA